MANNIPITQEQLSRAFRNYLRERFDGDTEEADSILETAEHVVPPMLNEYFGTHFTSLYDLTLTDDIEAFRHRIKAQPILKDLDMRAEPRYTEVLKWYKLFVKALNAGAMPIPVPGEAEEKTDLSSAPTKAESELTPSPIVENTIYLEGEAGEAQPAELRKRNRRLRQACIDYYRTLHGGRIVCECCGFYFREAYDIDDDYIEVHHRYPFSQTEGEHPVNAQTDLVPLCANCHRMIHHHQGGKGACMSLEELKEKYRGMHH